MTRRITGNLCGINQRVANCQRTGGKIPERWPLAMRFRRVSLPVFAWRFPGRVDHHQSFWMRPSPAGRWLPRYGLWVLRSRKSCPRRAPGRLDCDKVQSRPFSCGDFGESAALSGFPMIGKAIKRGLSSFEPFALENPACMFPASLRCPVLRQWRKFCAIVSAIPSANVRSFLAMASPPEWLAISHSLAQSSVRFRPLPSALSRSAIRWRCLRMSSGIGRNSILNPSCSVNFDFAVHA